MSKLIGRWVDGSTISNFHMDHTDSYEFGGLTVTGDSSFIGDATFSNIILSNLQVNGDMSVVGDTSVADISVSGNVYALDITGSNLLITQDASITGNLYASDITGSSLLIAQDASIVSSLNASDITGSSLLLTQDASIAGNLYASDITGSSLLITQDASIVSSLNASDITGSSLFLTQDASVAGNLYASDITGSSLLITQDASIAGNLYASDITGSSLFLTQDSSVLGDSSVGGNLKVDGTAQIGSGTLTLDSSRIIGSGDIIISPAGILNLGNILVNGDGTVSGNLKIDGTAQIGLGTLTIDSSRISGSGDIFVNAAGIFKSLTDSTFIGNVQVDNSINIGSDGTISGNLKVDGTVQIGAGTITLDSSRVITSGALYLSPAGSLQITSDATFSGDMSGAGLSISGRALFSDSTINNLYTTSAGGPGLRRNVAFSIFEADQTVTVGDGLTLFPIPLDLNNWNLIDAIATVDKTGDTSSTDIMIRRKRGGSNADMLSVPVTIANEYYARDGVIDTNNDDVATGDNLFVDVDATTVTAPIGLSVCLTFEK